MKQVCVRSTAHHQNQTIMCPTWQTWPLVEQPRPCYLMMRLIRFRFKLHKRQDGASQTGSCCVSEGLRSSFKKLLRSDINPEISLQLLQLLRSIFMQLNWLHLKSGLILGILVFFFTHNLCSSDYKHYHFAIFYRINRKLNYLTILCLLSHHKTFFKQ